MLCICEIHSAVRQRVEQIHNIYHEAPLLNNQFVSDKDIYLILSRSDSSAAALNSLC